MGKFMVDIISSMQVAEEHDGILSEIQNYFWQQVNYQRNPLTFRHDNQLLTPLYNPEGMEWKEPQKFFHYFYRK